VSVEVVHEPTRRRFVAYVGGRENRLFYMPGEEGVVEFRHTWVDPSLRGQGVGERLVLTALDWARAEGLSVIPTCWYVSTVVRRHPEYEALIRL
jgi:uncharacterized protein